MRTLLSVVLASLLPCALAAQDFVRSGDVSNGITGWTGTGCAASPGPEVFDVTGLGAQTCHGAGHGGQFTPPPGTVQVARVAFGIPTGPTFAYHASLQFHP